MARPAWPERSRSARSSRQLSRFYHSINPDRVFGTHTPHRIFDIVGLKLSPALDLGLISVLRVFLEIFTGELSRERMRSGELLSDEWVFHVSRLPEGLRR